jgi:hypothetical protein
MGSQRSKTHQKQPLIRVFDKPGTGLAPKYRIFNNDSDESGRNHGPIDLIASKDTELNHDMFM